MTIWTHRPARWLALTGSVFLLAGMTFVGLAPMSAATDKPKDVCTELGYDSGVKIDNPQAGAHSYSAGGFSVDMNITSGEAGEVMDFSSASTGVSYSVTNEFGTTLSTSKPVTEQFVSPLSMIDTTNPNQSIFGIGVQGSQTGTIAIAPQSAGVLAV